MGCWMYLVTETSNTRYEAYAEMCVCVCVSVCVMCTCVPTDLRGVRLLTEYQRQVRQVISGWHPSKNQKGNEHWTPNTKTLAQNIFRSRGTGYQPAPDLY